MRDTTTRPWRGISAEDRRNERRDRLIAAGLRVIGTKGWSETTVREVSAEAGLIARYFYEAFEDREALLTAVFDHIAEEGTRIVIEAFTNASGDSKARVRAPIAALLEWMTDDPCIGRVLLLEAATGEALQQKRHDLMLSASTVMAGLAKAHIGDTRQFDPTDVTLSALAIVGAEAELATAYLAGRLDVSRDRLIDHVTEMHLALIDVTSVPEAVRNRRDEVHR